MNRKLGGSNQSGIYSIFNKVSEKYYIGSTKRFTARWHEHVKKLELNSHANPHLQNSWNKYGKGSFVFEVLEITPTCHLVSTEQRYLDFFKPEYNICKTAYSTLGIKQTPQAAAKGARSRTGLKRSEETCRKLSEIKKNYYSKNPLTLEQRAEISKRLIGNKNRLGGKKYVK